MASGAGGGTYIAHPRTPTKTRAHNRPKRDFQWSFFLLDRMINDWTHSTSDPCRLDMARTVRNAWRCPRSCSIFISPRVPPTLFCCHFSSFALCPFRAFQFLDLSSPDAIRRRRKISPSSSVRATPWHEVRSIARILADDGRSFAVVGPKAY